MCRRAPRRRGRTARRSAPARRGGMPGPRSTIRTSRRAADRARAHRDRLAAGVAQRVLEQVRERALELRGVGVDQRQVAVDREAEPRPGRRRAPRRRRAQDLLDRAPVAPRLGGARPAAARGRAASRPARVSRAASSDDRGAPARAGRSSGSAGEPAPRRPATIAVSGERRSCETARSSAVLSSSLRRSAADSTTSRASASRSSAAASSASSARERCARSRRASTGAGVVAGDEQRADRPRSRSGSATRRASPSAPASSSIAADGSSSAAAMRCAAAAERAGDARAAEQQPRQLGAEVGLAAALLGLARARARPASASGARRSPRRQ